MIVKIATFCGDFLCKINGLKYNFEMMLAINDLANFIAMRTNR